MEQLPCPECRSPLHLCSCRPALQPNQRCHPDCNGWALFNEDTEPEIQRCDECELFDTDEDAVKHVAKLAEWAEHVIAEAMAIGGEP